MFLNLLFFSSILSISSNSWFGMWLGMEVNMLSMITLMNNVKNSFSSESSMKYFITQAISSSVMLMSIILLNYSMMKNYSTMMINSSMFMKMGAAPFHFWFPEIMEGLNWMNSLLILSWQKIAPMMVMNYNKSNLLFIILVILFSITIGAIMGLNQMSMRKIMTYSSINHLGWMIMSLMLIESIWMMYFLIYCFILVNIILIMNLNKSFLFNQLMNSLSKFKFMKLMFMVNFLSLGGLPPFLGFIPKWFTIQWMMVKNFTMMGMIMVCFTLITLFFYIRIIMISLSLNSNETLSNCSNNKNFYLMMFNAMNISSLLLFSLFMMT
uniref:NADH-ubiquinone oxidoreductase chain 2 n=1 Tax=Diartiger fossulatus TaxID=1535458 RepID=A0A0S2M751_9COLE|nr:NADH deshydrogenase subunit 2 [Diartiger fossulatus]